MADDTIKNLLQEASFSFIGTIEQFGAATMANLPIDDHTAVVHVDHILDSPPSFANYDGHRITVQLSPSAELPAAGTAAAFFTNGMAFGDSIAVSEVGRLPVADVEPHATAALTTGFKAGAFRGIRTDMRSERLRVHATAESDAVVVGRVVKVEKALPVTASEHDPDWWRATIDVRHVERGNVPLGDLEVLYPNSIDVRWYNVPKPAPSSDGVWILHATEGALRDAAPFQIKDADDHQPVEELDSIRGR